MLNKELLLDRISAENVTFKMLYEHLGMSKNTWLKYMNGEKIFDVAQAEDICDFLHITSNDAKCNIFLSKVAQ